MIDFGNLNVLEFLSMRGVQWSCDAICKMLKLASEGDDTDSSFLRVCEEWRRTQGAAASDACCGGKNRRTRDTTEEEDEKMADLYLLEEEKIGESAWELDAAKFGGGEVDAEKASGEKEEYGDGRGEFAAVERELLRFGILGGGGVILGIVLEVLTSNLLRVCGEEVKVAVEEEGKAMILSGDVINVRIGVAENVKIEKREMMVVVVERMSVLSLLPNTQRSTCSFSFSVEEEEKMEWWMSMPKVELHAHLNGSIRGSTLLELARALWDKGLIDFSQVEHVILKMFKAYNGGGYGFVNTDDHMTVTRIANEVVEDFASEKVVYLELRTTPKKNDSQGMSKRSYVEAVLEGIRSVSSVDVALIPYTEDPRNLLDPLHAATNDKCNGNSRKKIFVRLLLSVDRRETTEATMETVKLALEMRHLGVVGIDLSGNPKVGEWYVNLSRTLA
ncbi:hypothetical protein Ahy_A01g001181 isoform A [Arachis hypogaea]|uniref:Adenosine deaminase domain-containing protein n=1 Tax=Arachis hypogaea TaxID=3818 RepID=A0A445EMK4_ARAHY|nr:hypothetical protein Ahy_A01g001181 isoform A [Arachis hypogaea]